MEDDVRQRTCFPLLPVGLGKRGGGAVSMARRQERGCGTARWGRQHSLQAFGRMNDLNL